MSIIITTFFYHLCILQGASKITFPGSVNIMWNNCVCLPTAGMKTQFFHPLFSQPGKHSLEIPCKPPSPSVRTSFWMVPDINYNAEKWKSCNKDRGIKTKILKLLFVLLPPPSNTRAKCRNGIRSLAHQWSKSLPASSRRQRRRFVPPAASRPRSPRPPPPPRPPKHPRSNLESTPQSLSFFC